MVLLAVLAAGVALPPDHDAGLTLRGPRVHLSARAGPAAGAYSLPVPDSLVTMRDLRAPHHDYPASDLMVPTGTPVFAAHHGPVQTHEGARCGLGVSIVGDDGYRYVNCHLSVIAVADGARVAAGDVIGLSGDTGNAIGVPHLHFHVRAPDGAYLCPQPLFVEWWRANPVGPRGREVRDGCSFPRS